MAKGNELEFDGAFGAWRGVHYEAKVETMHLTRDTAYGRAPLMISICRVTGKIKMDLPREEFLELEEAEIQRLRSLPTGQR